jgi:tetratricopeptide (TPR) repeat protein
VRALIIEGRAGAGHHVAERSEIEQLLRDGRVDDAGVLVAEILADDPEDADALVQHARIRASLGDVEPAVEALEHVLELEPDHADALAHLGAILVEQRTGRGEALLRRALDKNPDQPIALLSLGRAAAQRGDFDTALQHIQQAAIVDSENAFAHYALARVHAERNDAQLAFESVARAVRLNPELVEGWITLAGLQNETGGAEDAAENLETALTVNPGDPALLDALVNSRILAGDLGGAIDAATRLFEALPDNPVVGTNLAIALIAAGRYPDAEQVLRVVLGHDEEHVPALHALAMMLDATDDTAAISEARDLLEKAVELDINHWRSVSDLGVLLMTREGHLDLERARGLVEDAVEQAGDEAAEPLFNLALVCAKEGDMRVARDALRRLRDHPRLTDDLKEAAAELAKAMG